MRALVSSPNHFMLLGQLLFVVWQERLAGSGRRRLSEFAAAQYFSIPQNHLVKDRIHDGLTSKTFMKRIRLCLRPARSGLRAAARMPLRDGRRRMELQPFLRLCSGQLFVVRSFGAVSLLLGSIIHTSGFLRKRKNSQYCTNENRIFCAYYIISRGLLIYYTQFTSFCFVQIDKETTIWSCRRRTGELSEKRQKTAPAGLGRRTGAV